MKQGVDSFNQMKSGDILGGIASTTNTVTGIVSGLASNQGTKLPTSAVNKNNSNDDDDDDKNNQTNTVGKDNLKAAQANNNFYANVGVNLGFNKSSSKSNSHSERAVVTAIKGKDENSSITYNNVKNVEYVGTQAQDTKFIYNNVENINKTAVELKNSYSSTGKSSGISTGVTVNYNNGFQTEGNGVSISASKSKMNSNGTTYQNGRFVNVDEVHNNTKNMTLSGFNQEGGTVTGNIENLTIESKQNTSTTRGRTIGGSLSIAPNGMPSGSANYSQTNGERRFVDNASTFIIGDGSNLKVAKVENTASAIGTTGNGKLSIDEYVGHNLENVDKLKTAGGSVGVSTSGVNNIGINYSDKKQEGITKNTVIGNVEIGKSSGDEINRDLDTMTEITEDRDFKTNVNIESQTINYIKNPEKFKEDLQKAKSEVEDLGNVVKNTVNPSGEDKRNIFENLRAPRWSTTFYNVIGSRVEELSRQFKAGEINEENLKEAVRDIVKGYGKDIGIDFDVVYLDESTMPKDSKGSTGSSYIVDEKNRKVLIPIDVNKIGDVKELLGTLTEEVAHGKDALEGRQDKKVAADKSNDEEGLESLGRPANEYVKKKLGEDNNSKIKLSTDGIDLSNADVGKKVGDVFLKSEIDAAGGVKKVFSWDPDKGITLTETGHFLTGFSEALLADMLLNPNLIPEKYKYRSLAYKYGELSGHSTMLVLGILGNIVGSSMGGGGTAAAPVTGGVSLTVAGGGIAVQTYSVGVIGVSSIGSVKVGLEIKTMKSEGGSSESGEIVNEDLGEINEEQQIKDNFDNLTDKEKEVFEKYEKNGWKGQYGKEGPSKAGGDFDNTGEGGGEILPRKDANGNNITYKEFDINRKDPVTNNRDSKRFVSGSDGSVYYTDDHYMTFKRIK